MTVAMADKLAAELKALNTFDSDSGIVLLRSEKQQEIKEYATIVWFSRSQEFWKQQTYHELVGQLANLYALSQVFRNNGPFLTRTPAAPAATTASSRRATVLTTAAQAARDGRLKRYEATGEYGADMARRLRFDGTRRWIRVLSSR